MRIRMKRPKLPSDHLSSNLGDELCLSIHDDGSFTCEDSAILNTDVVFLREIIGALTEKLKSVS